MTLTELERIDFNRRADIARAIVPVASAAMQKKKELTEAIQQSTAKSKSYWYLAIGGAGYAIHYFISGYEYKFDAGVWLTLMTLGLWCGRQFDQHTDRRALAGVLDSISDLQMRWESVIGDKDDFNRIGDFDIGWRIDWQDDALSEWWTAQTSRILMRVCDVEKAMDLSAKSSKRDEASAAIRAMRHQRENP